MKPFLLAVLASAMAWAQAQQQAIIDVKYADVNQLSTMLRGVFGSGVQGNPAFHVITVTGSSDTVAAVTAAVKRFDVPPQPQPDVELTVYLISGLAQGQGDEVPQELAPTVKQLRALFTYKSYKLADSVMLRGRPVVGADNRGGAQVDGAALNGRYNLSYQYLNVSPEAPRTIHIEGLNFRLNLPRPRTVNADGKTTTVTDFNDQVARISTNLDIREGQKTVVGKSSVGSGDAVILVIVPKVAD